MRVVWWLLQFVQSYHLRDLCANLFHSIVIWVRLSNAYYTSECIHSPLKWCHHSRYTLLYPRPVNASVLSVHRNCTSIRALIGWLVKHPAVTRGVFSAPTALSFSAQGFYFTIHLFSISICTSVAIQFSVHDKHSFRRNIDCGNSSIITPGTSINS